jgi:hypothetical protein
MPKFRVTECRKCGRALDGGSGRPSRWCSPGCKTSGEAEMRRVSVHIRQLENDLHFHRVHPNPLLNSKLVSVPHVDPRQELIDELQARYDHLAGVPGAES